jgi:RHS repeat-associated protein
LISAHGKESGGATNRLHEQFGYGYDAGHNLSLRTNNALVQTFTVNALNELSNATRTGTFTVAGDTTSAATNITVNGGNAVLYGDFSFAKDGFSLTNGNNNYTAIGRDALGRLDTNAVTVNLPSTVAFTYDLNGNLLSDGKRGFDYDEDNQLIRVTVTNASKSEFVYDAARRMRIRKEFNWTGSWNLNSETRYIYDGSLVLQERDGNNLPRVTYTRGRDLSGGLQGAGGIGGLLARTDNSVLQVDSANAHAFYHADGSGNITALVNSGQVPVANYAYDPFGNLLSQSGPLAEANVYRFSSKEAHPASGLYYYGFRFYDPTLQRWINQDPIREEGGINVYGFVANDSQNGVDPLGLLDLSDLSLTPAADWMDKRILYAEDRLSSRYGYLNFHLYNYTSVAHGFVDLLRFGNGVGDATFNSQDGWDVTIGITEDVVRGSGLATLVGGGLARACPEPKPPIIKPAPSPPRVSRTKWGPEHGKGNIAHNNAIEDVLDAAEERGATSLRKNRVQRDVGGNRVAPRRGGFVKPDASWVENGIRYNFNRVSNLSALDREVDALIRMFEADPNAVNMLEF